MRIKVVVVASPLYACCITDKNKNGTAGSCCSLECSSTREITTVYRLSHLSLFISKSLEISFRFCLVRDGVADFSWCSNTQCCCIYAVWHCQEKSEVSLLWIRSAWYRQFIRGFWIVCLHLVQIFAAVVAIIETKRTSDRIFPLPHLLFPSNMREERKKT